MINKNIIYNILTIVILSIIFYFIWSYNDFEIINSSDGVFYYKISNILLNNSFNPFLFLNSYEVNNSNIFYLGSIYYFGILNLLFAENWSFIFIILNIFSLILVFYFIQKQSYSINLIPAIFFF